jgi:hypothetical protein
VASAQHSLQYLLLLPTRTLTGPSESRPLGKQENSGPTVNGGVSWVFCAARDTRLQQASLRRCRAAAADYPIEPATSSRPLLSPQPIAQWESEIGGRYWYSSGRTQLNLFGATQAEGLVSRLTYSDLQAHSGEVFGRAEHLSGFFIKGFVGGGAITGGGLRDEDFPPGAIPYSSTNSEQRDGRLAYATVDLGWTWRSEGKKLGFLPATFITSNARMRSDVLKQPQIRSSACRQFQVQS